MTVYIYRRDPRNGIRHVQILSQSLLLNEVKRVVQYSMAVCTTESE
jgi:hypothetical protein